MADHPTIAVYGAAGHTGRFVIRELQRRGVAVVGVARDAARIPAGIPAHAARVDDPRALDRAFAGCAVVINCAGPFMDTARPVADAALRAGASYLDVTSEQRVAQALFDEYDASARAAGVCVIPAVGFYGGLADLLATALADAAPIDDLTTAIALDHWWPTQGTRITGARNTVPRLMIERGQLVPIAPSGPQRDWLFAEPFGVQRMVELSFSEVVAIARHLKVDSLHSYLNTIAVADVRDAATPPPTAIDADGRSAQHFMIDVEVRQGAAIRRARASGQDIYAVSAPIAVEAALRLLAPSFDKRGALALGQAFDAHAFLDAIASPHLAISIG